MLRDMESYLRKRGYSLRRFAWFYALAGLAGVVLGLVGVVTNWSDGVSFAVTAVVGGAISMAALWENPLGWFRGYPEERRKDRRPSP